MCYNNKGYLYVRGEWKMGIFDSFKKKKEEIIKSGSIEKKPSYIAVVPKSEDILSNTEAMMYKLLSLPYITPVSKKTTDDGFEIVFGYKEKEYRFCVYVSDFELPEAFRIGHDFTEEEIYCMESARKVLSSEMVFAGDNCDGYHLQIKLLCEMVEDPAGIVDFSAERMLAGRWARLAAKSSVAPSPDYMYVMQCVAGDNGDVWIHTHGLNRVGSVELEILKSDKENYPKHADIIGVIAKRIISRDLLGNEYEPVYIMRLTEEIPIVATWISFEKAVKMYPSSIVGSMEDRQDWHNEDTGVVYLYEMPDDIDKKKLSHVGVFNELYGHNSMAMITTEETERMKALAVERIGYLVSLFEAKDSFKEFGVLVKIGLEVDDEFKDVEMKEHSWFELCSVNAAAQTLEGKLTHGLYYIASLKEGDMRTSRFDEITDWIAYCDGDRITPDSVYKLEK